MLFWGPGQDTLFIAIKQKLAKPMILAMYHPATLKTKSSTDTSSHGLGAVILQQSPSSNQWKPVAYASLAMTNTEKRYAQIEKEAFVATRASERFFEYDSFC